MWNRATSICSSDVQYSGYIEISQYKFLRYNMILLYCAWILLTFMESYKERSCTLNLLFGACNDVTCIHTE